jgi:hypothetical protein
MLGNISTNYLLKITTPKELTSKYIKCLVYGATGSRKTTFASTFPHVLLLDTNKGTKTIQDRDDIQVIPLERTFFNERGVEENSDVYKTVMAILKDAKYKRGAFAEGQPLAKIETIVIDDLTDLGSYMHYATLKFISRKDPITQKADFDTWDSFLNQMEDIISMLKSIPYHVVLTSQEKLEVDDNTKELIGGVMLKGSMRHTVPYGFDEFYHFVVESKMGKTSYKSYFVPNGSFQAKSRLKFTDPKVNLTFADLEAQNNKLLNSNNI